LATITKLSSGSWRVQVRRKGKYVNETFLRRKDAEEWAREVERRIDRREPTVARRSRDAKSFGDLVRLHREDLHEVGKPIGRSKAASLNSLEGKLGQLRLQELSREKLIQFGKERAREGAGPVTRDRPRLHQDDPLPRRRRPRRGRVHGGGRPRPHCSFASRARREGP
jgi:hypothetical protein